MTNMINSVNVYPESYAGMNETLTAKEMGCALTEAASAAIQEYLDNIREWCADHELPVNMVCGENCNSPEFLLSMISTIEIMQDEMRPGSFSFNQAEDLLTALRMRYRLLTGEGLMFATLDQLADDLLRPYPAAAFAWLPEAIRDAAERLGVELVPDFEDDWFSSRSDFDMYVALAG